MLKRLLRRGYFPAGLSPFFDTTAFADAATRAANLPQAFTQDTPRETKPCCHNLARSGGLRRRLTLVNPVNFFRLAACFEENKRKLRSAWKASQFSLTKPSISKKNERALGPAKRQKALESAKRRVGQRFVIKTDVSEFYPSIYTHCIAWALHGKKEAKARRTDMSLLGNQLDREVRYGQEGQTKGIPIGPDTSMALAEIVLGCVDVAINARLPALSGMRFVDDMYFFTETQSAAEKLLMHLETELSEFELQLNHKKTVIGSLPQTLDNNFLSDLRMRLPTKNTRKNLEWADYFDGAFALAGAQPYDNVLRYAVSLVENIQSSAAAWPVVQHLFWQTVAIDPGTIRFVLSGLLRNHAKGLPLDNELAAVALNSLIRTSAPYGHGSEVAWALWALSVLRLHPSDDAWQAVLKMPDDVVAISAHTANEVGNWGFDVNSETWDSWLEPGCFEGEHWLYCYEACRNTWCRKALRAELFKGEAGTLGKFLHKENVSFINTNAPQDFLRVKRRQGFGSLALA
jgi:hypothetical protein